MVQWKLLSGATVPIEFVQWYIYKIANVGSVYVWCISSMCMRMCLNLMRLLLFQFQSSQEKFRELLLDNLNEIGGTICNLQLLADSTTQRICYSIAWHWRTCIRYQKQRTFYFSLYYNYSFIFYVHRTILKHLSILQHLLNLRIYI